MKRFDTYNTDLETNKNILEHPSRKVGQYTLDGKLVKIYDTVREARKDFSNVNKVLKGTATKCKGYTFKYMS
ncbi:MAG: NUMOD1 domain-containing DNA-binding protein [Candidatus Coprovivens sp.]